MASSDLGIIKLSKAVEEDLDIGTREIVVDHPAGGTQRGNQINLGTFALGAEQIYAPTGLNPGETQVVNVPCLGAVRGYPAIVTFSGTWGHDNFDIRAEVIIKNEVRVFIHNYDLLNSLSVGSGTLRVFAFPIPLE